MTTQEADEADRLTDTQSEMAPREAIERQDEAVSGDTAFEANEGASTQQDAPTTDTTPSDVQAVAAAVEADSKIVNELQELKAAVNSRTEELSEALQAERQASLQQAEELSMLRNELESALAERDQRSSEEIAELRDRIEKIQTGGIPASRQAMAALALNSLQQRVATGEAFGEQLDVLARLAPEAPVVSTLRPFANEGVPTIATLRSDFAAARRRAMAEYREETAEGPFGKLAANFRNLVSVRPASPQDGEDPVAVVSRAEAYLDENEISDAVAELETLQGAAASGFSDWIAIAEKTATAHQAIDEMNAALLNQFGGDAK